MNMAVFFQKHSGKTANFVKKIYLKCFLRTNAKRIKYLKDAGARIGENVFLPDISIVGSEPYLVDIGDNVYFSGTTTKLFTHDGGVMQLKYMGITEKKFDLFGRIKIGSNCFIGNGVTILKNVTIGDNVIIGAGAVVSKSIPSNSVVAGVPAKVVCSISEYYEKNKKNYDETFGLNQYKKREYIETNFDKYEKMRKKKEVFKNNG